MPEGGFLEMHVNGEGRGEGRGDGRSRCCALLDWSQVGLRSLSTYPDALMMHTRPGGALWLEQVALDLRVAVV